MSTQVPIPISSPTYKNVDKSVINDNNYVLYDGFLDEKGATNKRPSLIHIRNLIDNISAGATDLNFPTLGIYYWQKRDCVILVSKKRIIKIDRGYDSNSIAGLQWGLRTTNLTGTGLPQSSGEVSFAADETTLYMANGGQIFYTDGTTTTQYIADAEAPTNAKQIAWIDGYLLSISGTDNSFYFSNVNDPLTWDALDFASAVGDGDNLVSLKVYEKDIYLIGQKSVELWRNDGVTPFSLVSGGFIQIGCSAPDSVVVTKEGLYWLDTRNRLIVFNGRNSEEFNMDYLEEVYSYGTPSDCVGFNLTYRGQDLIVFQFLSANKTLVFNKKSQGWSEWRSYVDNNTFSRWRAGGVVYATDWNLYLARDSFNFGVHNLCGVPTPSTPLTPTSLTIAESSDYINGVNIPVVLNRITGHISYGANNRKRSNKISLRVKRGSNYSTYSAGGSAVAPYMTLRVNDDNLGWSNEFQIDLGEIGNFELIREVYIGGIFRTRQYEFKLSDAVPGILIEAFEYLDVLNDS